MTKTPTDIFSHFQNTLATIADQINALAVQTNRDLAEHGMTWEDLAGVSPQAQILIDLCGDVLPREFGPLVKDLQMLQALPPVLLENGLLRLSGAESRTREDTIARTIVGRTALFAKKKGQAAGIPVIEDLGTDAPTGGN